MTIYEFYELEGVWWGCSQNNIQAEASKTVVVNRNWKPVC
jgi:hypothetical protein